MKYLKLKLRTKSGFSNLFTADQIWGQMVFAISDLKGFEEASKFVENFDSNPPFLISNMYPEGYLPRAVLPPIKTNSSISSSFDEEKKNRELAKKNKKKTFVPIKTFLQCQDDISKLKFANFESSPNIRVINEVRSSISRKTGFPHTQEGGGVFNQTFYYSQDVFNIYIKLIDTSDEGIKLLEEIILYLNMVGIGGDRSIGKGAFNITLSEVNEDEKILFSYDKGNAYMSLSRCSGKDLNPLYYQIQYYFGMVGAKLDEKRTLNKYPVIYFEPGSLFLSGKGELLHNVHTDSRICSYGYSFPIYLNI